MSTEHKEVIVIGAGISGLSAATLLREQEIDVCVLEASSRVGGRLQTVHKEAIRYVDLGGAYISHTQRRLLGLLSRYGIKTYTFHGNGDSLCYRDGRVIRYTSDTLPMSTLTDKLDSNHVLRSLNYLCRQIPLNEPWNAPDAHRLDRMTYQEWLDKTVSSKSVKANVTMLARANFCAEPHDVSLLWALWDMKTAGGMANMNSCGDGTQEMLVDGGTQQLPDAMASQLKDRVLLEEVVHHIQSNGDGVTVRTSKGHLFKARRVIMALPPNAQGRIVLDPVPSVARNQLIQRVPMGSIIKTFVYYERAYWREKGLSGLLTVEDDNFPIITCYDDTKSDGSHPCLMGFIASQKARSMSMMSKEERCRHVAAQYASMFGCPELSNPIHYEDYDWSMDSWAGGGYSGIMSPGVLTQFGWTLRKPEGLVHYAGTETASVWPGYIEGAIEAGHRAAREVLLAFGKPVKDIMDANIEQDLTNNEPDISLKEKILPSATDFKKAALAGGLALTAASCVGKNIWAKL